MSTTDKVKILSDASLRDEGFSVSEIESAGKDRFVGERNGIQYFRAEGDMIINEGEYKTIARLPSQIGDRD